MGGRLHRPLEALTIPEAAALLSKGSGSEVTEAEIIRRGLEGRLTLSVQFESRPLGRLGKTVRPGQAKRVPPETLSEWDRQPREYQVSENEILLLDLPFQFVAIEGIWDLVMLGPERGDIEYRYMLSDGRRLTRDHLDGIFLKQPEGKWCQLWEERPDHEGGTRAVPMRALPDAAVLVVRTGALDEVVRATPAGTLERAPTLESVARPQQGSVEDADPSAAFDLDDQDLSTTEGRIQAVNRFLECCNEESELSPEILRTHIWTEAGYGNARSFQHWQAMDPARSTRACDENMRRVLSTSPADFVAQVRTRTHRPARAFLGRAE